MQLPRPTALSALLDDDDVLPTVHEWRAQGLRTALVTLVSVEGGAPRQPGAQMAVAEDGRYVGYLSGGCLEQAVALEAKAVIANRSNRLVRYGKGSPYFDIRLPCGSGLDLYFDQGLDGALLDAVLQNRSARRTSRLITQLSNGQNSVESVLGSVPPSRRAGEVFERIYPPALRLVLIGNGPALTGIAVLAKTAGIDAAVWSTDEVTREQLCSFGIRVYASEDDLEVLAGNLDVATASVVVFHEHDVEPRVLKMLLETPAFYIGVLGNRAVHRARREALQALGVSEIQVERLHAPVGTITNAKSKTTFAFGVLAELLATAKSLNLVP